MSGKSSTDTTVLIVGGGIGGLATALALRRKGIAASVFERAPVLQAVGAGIGIGANGLYALEKLGVAEAVKAAGAPVDRVELRDQDGKVLSAVTRSPLERQLGVVTTLVHRAVLHAALAEALDAESLQLDREVVGLYQDETGVAVRFSNGDEAHGSILIGADGLLSTVRAHLWGAEPPRYAGYTSCRGVLEKAPEGLPSGTGFEAWGRGRRFGLFHIGRGRAYWYATWNAPPGGADTGEKLKPRLEDLFADWAAPVPQALAATPAASLIRTDICDRPPLTRWGKGRVSLLGDAAHPTTPNLGQGACMAIEDALVLARCLSDHADQSTALRAYEDRCRARTAAIVSASRRMGRVGQWENPIACWLRNATLRATPHRLARRRSDAMFREAVLHLDG